MIGWIFRAVALLGTPRTYYTVSKDPKGLALGYNRPGLIGVEYVLESVSLFSLIVGIIGAVVGVIVSKLWIIPSSG